MEREDTTKDATARGRDALKTIVNVTRPRFPVQMLADALAVAISTKPCLSKLYTIDVHNKMVQFLQIFCRDNSKDGMSAMSSIVHAASQLVSMSESKPKLKIRPGSNFRNSKNKFISLSSLTCSK
jgi:hypothetical protein